MVTLHHSNPIYTGENGREEHLSDSLIQTDDIYARVYGMSVSISGVVVVQCRPRKASLVCHSHGHARCLAIITAYKLLIEPPEVKINFYFQTLRSEYLYV